MKGGCVDGPLYSAISSLFFDVVILLNSKVGPLSNGLLSTPCGEKEELENLLILRLRLLLQLCIMNSGDLVFRKDCLTFSSNEINSFLKSSETTPHTNFAILLT